MTETGPEPTRASTGAAGARRRDGWSKAGGRWTHELVGYALDRFHRLHLRTPTVRELRAGVDDLPSFATIVRLYGTTSAMFLRHGYQPRRHGAQGRSARNHLLMERDSGGRFAGRRLDSATA
jgi:hypothetical protein